MKTITTIERTEVKPLSMGPIAIHGHLKVVLPNGIIEIKERCFLCRCGKSNKHPYCDGSHSRQ